MRLALHRWLGAAVALVAVGTAAAGARADLGPHQNPANPNTCRVCHNTATGVPVLRAWAGGSVPSGAGAWAAKPISSLCYMCHQSGGGGYGGHDMSANAYAATSHGFMVSSVPREPDGSPQGTRYRALSVSTLPYARQAQLECTSCHDAHRAANRPFLHRSSIAALCDECHQGRANGTSATTIPGSLRSYSTHPTGTLLQNTPRARIKGVDEIDGVLKTATLAAPDWALGGHLSDPVGNTGPIDCQTCHAVHGPGAGLGGLKKLLAIDNETPAGTATPSRLCEGCHTGGAEGEQVGSVVLQSGLSAGQWSDHPIDASGNRTAFYPTAAALPTLWLKDNTPNADWGAQPYYQGTQQTPVCSSCHDIHGGIALTPLLRGPLPGGVWSPFGNDAWCFSCHTAAALLPAAHHSTIQNLSLAGGDAMDSQLSCGDCHGAAGTEDWTAHNGFWGPLAVSATDGAFCMACHAGDNPADLVAPALKGQTFVEPAAFPSSHGTARGTSSHYLGLDSDEFPGVAPKVTAWSSGYFSSYGTPNTGGGGLTAPAAAGSVICQSCHHMLYNDGRANPANYTSAARAGWQSNLLLEPYQDDPTGTGAGAGANAVGSALCSGCHTASGYHHPQTGDVVPMSGLPLRTGPGSFADQTAAPGTLSYPNLNQLDCDSCHRPHRADSDSDVAGAADTNHGGSLSKDALTTRHILEVDGASHRYTDLCAECHLR